MTIQKGMLSGSLANYTAEQVEKDFNVSLAPLKYEFTDEQRVIKLTDDDAAIQADIIYHRIRAIRDFADVKAGDLGGWIAEGAILDQAGTCWIYDDARLTTNSVVSGAVAICGDSSISGSVRCAGVIKDSRIIKCRIDGTVDIRTSKLCRCRLHGEYVTLANVMLDDARFGSVTTQPSGKYNISNFKNHIPMTYSDGVNIQGNDDLIFLRYQGRSFAFYPALGDVNAFQVDGKKATNIPAIIIPGLKVIENAVANRSSVKSRETSYFN